MSDVHAPGKRRLWLIGAGGFLLLAALFAACLLLALVQQRPAQISARQQRLAEYALQNPNTAAIALGLARYSDWYPADGDDYAVENGRVIFPQPPGGNSITQPLSNVLPDKDMPALVYAPGYRSLPTNGQPPIPDGRTWAYMGEWFLYRCRPLRNSSGWWDCRLFVGGNI